MKNKAIRKLEIATDKISTAISLLKKGGKDTNKLELMLNDLYRQIDSINN